MSTTVPYAEEAEWNIVARMLTTPDSIPEIIGQQLELDDFYRPDTRLIFEAVVTNYYADIPVDPVTIGERLRDPLSRQWECGEQDVARQLYQQASSRGHVRNTNHHAKIVKDKAILRRLEALMGQTRNMMSDPDMTPEQIGDRLAQGAANITTGGKKRSEILSYADVGRQYIAHLQHQRLAKQQGIELAVYTGYKFIDLYTKGVAPTELMFVAGEPGVGKSAVTWAMAHGFARRQLTKPDDKRVATLVLSLEMALIGSSARLSSAQTGVEGERLREGDISDDELSLVMKGWKNLEGLPLYWNFSSNFRMSQMRALIVEAIRRHNVGLVVVDHFRMFDPDRRINNPNQEDEAKARFLKEDIAKDLNVAVVCLAHTVKTPRDGDPRPRLADLRGSGQVAAHADIVAMMFRPYMHATENEKIEGVISPTDSEMIFAKNRNGSLGTSEFYFEAGRMTIRDN